MIHNIRYPQAFVIFVAVALAVVVAIDLNAGNTPHAVRDLVLGVVFLTAALRLTRRPPA